MYFWCLQFSQKVNENNSTWGTIVVKSNFFVCFLGELRIQKRHFEINWPLSNVGIFCCISKFSMKKKCFMANVTFKYYNSKKVVKLQGVPELYQSFSQETIKNRAIKMAGWSINCCITRWWPRQISGLFWLFLRSSKAHSFLAIIPIPLWWSQEKQPFPISFLTLELHKKEPSLALR